MKSFAVRSSSRRSVLVDDAHIDDTLIDLGERGQRRRNECGHDKKERPHKEKGQEVSYPLPSVYPFDSATGYQPAATGYLFQVYSIPT